MPLQAADCKVEITVSVGKKYGVIILIDFLALEKRLNIVSFTPFS
jgi:hypothetical protein